MSSNTQTVRPTIQSAYQPPPMHKSHGSIISTYIWGNFYLYMVTGDGEVFSFDLLDSYGGKICVTRFNAQHGNVIPATKILRNVTTNLEECDHKYLLQCQVQDHTGLTWVADFQEAGEEILGCSTKELYLKSQVQDDERFSNADKSNFFAEVLLKLKIKEETYADEQRLKVIVVKVDKMNYSSTTKYLLELIPKFY
ncbi:replication protein A 70 kDa DNA-binding subunit A [Tanacetum coccineum]